MKIKNGIIIFALLTSSICASGNTIYTKELDTDDINEVYQDRTTVLEKQLRYLINEIEILKNEHDIIKNKLENLEQNTSSPLSSKSNDTEVKNDSTQSPSADVVAINDDKTKESLKNQIFALAKKSEQEFYDESLKAFKDNHFEFSAEAFGVFVQKYPTSALISNAYYWLGESYAKQNMLSTAVVTYIKGNQKKPNGKKALDSLVKAAECLNKLKKNSEACTILRKITEEYPNKTASVNRKIEELKDSCGCR